MEKSSAVACHGLAPESDWVRRWSHLITPRGPILDIACGRGRHMQWFAKRGHPVTGVDRAAQAIHDAAGFGDAVLADIENGPWPLLDEGQARQFAAVIVTNYLWRPLFPIMIQSLAPAGVLIYETFAAGNETVGKPARPDFLLRPAELLSAFASLRIVAFEEGFLGSPPRFVQRLTAVRPESAHDGSRGPERYPLQFAHTR